MMLSPSPQGLRITSSHIQAVTSSNPFLEEEEGLKKDSHLADLVTELLMVATSQRSLHRSFPLLEPASPNLDVKHSSVLAAKISC